MRLERRDRFEEIAPLLDRVEKPTRYLDHEWGSCRELDGPFHVCLVYPDTYEVGLPNMGLAILRNSLNRIDGISCERGYLPWHDMADLMREHDIPMLALESAAPLASFDVVGFTIAHEMACTNIVETLDLACIPVRACDRAEDDAIIMGGGPSVWNCEPVAPMFDVVCLGDGEELLCEACLVVRDARAEGVSRDEILRRLAKVEGLYVPSLYDVRVDETSTEWGYAVPRDPSAPERVLKRVIADLGATEPLNTDIVPYMKTVFDRLSIEVLRGCARGCRFCQAGMTYRPVRERSADQVVEACERGLASTGYDEVSLTSLSTTDHSCCAEMIHRVNEGVRNRGVRMSIPSQRLDSFGVDMALEVAGGKKGGLTFAPEAGSQRLRDVINKNVTELDLERAATNAFENGWRRMKLYFMMGLPTETDEDIVAIPRLAGHVLDIARGIVPKGQRGGVSVSISVAVFVPKAYTPFQWAGQLPLAEVRERQRLLLASAPDRAVRIAYHDAETSQVEAVLSRSGRAAFELIYSAWRHGSRFDAWQDEFDYSKWRAAAEEVGMDLEAIASTPYEIGVRLPWEHTSPGVSMGYLEREWHRATLGQTTADCTRTSCTGCGVCPTLGVSNVLVGDRS
mgnify:CR=1 FL=1